MERIRVASSDWCPSRIVVSVISSLLLRRHPVGHGLRALLVEQVAGAVGRLVAGRSGGARRP